MNQQQQDLTVMLSRLRVYSAFYLGGEKPLSYFDQICALHHCSASGYAQTAQPFGAVFSQVHWPFSNTLFDLIILDNSLQKLSSLERTLREVSRVLKDDGQLIIIQTKAESLSFRSIHKILESESVEKIICHYYDEIKLHRPQTWLAGLMPESFSMSFMAHFKKQTIPMTPLFSGLKNKVKLSKKYATSVNNKSFKTNHINPVKPEKKYE